jgi:flagellar motor switch protein FliN/FliY
MSPTATLPEPAVLDALLAAADAFPIANLERTPAEIVTDLERCLPDGGGKFAAATFGDADRGGLLAIIVSFDVASGLFNANGKAPKLAAALTAAAKRLGVSLSAPSTGRGLEELPAVEAGGEIDTSVLKLHSAGEHVVTIVLRRADGRAADDAADAASFPQLEDAPAERPAGLATADARALSVIRSVEMNVTAELGRSTMTVRELLELTPGSVIELDRAAGSPVDLLVNGTIIARGEVVVIDEEYGIRVSEIIGSPDDL